MKIKLQFDAAVEIDGQHIDAKKGEEIEVEERVGRFLLEIEKAVCTEPADVEPLNR